MGLDFVRLAGIGSGAVRLSGGGRMDFQVATHQKKSGRCGLFLLLPSIAHAANSQTEATPRSKPPPSETETRRADIKFQRSTRSIRQG